jgi:hypothetical protein
MALLHARVRGLDVGRARLLHRVADRAGPSQDLQQEELGRMCVICVTPALTAPDHLGNHARADAPFRRGHHFRHSVRSLRAQVAVRREQCPVHRAGARHRVLSDLQGVPCRARPVWHCDGRSVWQRCRHRS